MDCKSGIKTWLKHVLVHSDCYNKKYHRLGRLETREIYFSQFWEVVV